MIVEGRRKLSVQLRPGLFADPAFDLLLSLYAAEESGRDLSITKAAADANIPMTTTLRWISTLVDAGLISRTQDHSDARRVMVHLSERAIDTLTKWLRSIAEHCTALAVPPDLDHDRWRRSA